MVQYSKCTKKVTDEICVRLANGESLNSICKDPHMPARKNVYAWAINPTRYPEFSRRYYLARRAQGHHYYDQLFDIANGMLVNAKDKNKGLSVRAAEGAARVLQWNLSRMACKDFSEKQQIDNTSSDGTMATPTNIQVNLVKSKKNDEY